jgi:hypothetical protein
MKNFRKLVFRHIELKLITTASIWCLSHPSMSITTWCMGDFATACLWKFTHFFILHRAISEKLQNIKIWKFAVFHTSLGTSSLPSLNKIGDGRLFSLVQLTWNDPNATLIVVTMIDKLVINDVMKHISYTWICWFYYIV